MVDAGPSPRRQPRTTLIAAALGSALAGCALIALAHNMNTRGVTRTMVKPQRVAPLVYVGTYTRHLPHATGRGEGIYAYRLDPATGALAFVGLTARVDNPSFLALDPTERYLYAVNEVEEYVGQPGGAVSASAVDPESGALTALNRQPTHGAAPCYVSVDRTGKWVLVANYGSGSLTVLPIQEGGRLGPATAVVQHHGSSVNPQRQEGPHAHSVIVDAENRYALAADLGLDKVLVYRFDAGRGTLTPHDVPSVAIEPGAGPRHLAFHPSGRYLYATGELDSTVTALAYDAEQGNLRKLQTVSMLPPGWTGTSYAADIHVAPSGKHLYASNRGHDSIAIFAIDEKAGTLTPLGHVPTQGRTPRNFALDPSGNYLLVANQDTDTIVTFRVDPATGWLTPTGHVAAVPSPVCVRIVERP